MEGWFFYHIEDVMSRQKVLFLHVIGEAKKRPRDIDRRKQREREREKKNEKDKQTKTTKLHIEAKIFSFFFFLSFPTTNTAARVEKKEKTRESERKKEGVSLLLGTGNIKASRKKLSALRQNTISSESLSLPLPILDVIAR